MKASITYAGVAMVCEYEHHRGYPMTMESPEEPEYVDVVSCEVGGTDIADLLSNAQLESIADEILKYHHEGVEYDKCEHADWLRDQQREAA